MRRPILALLVVLAAAGCATRAKVAPEAPPRTLPSAAELLDTLSARRAAVRAVRALARTSYASPEESRRVKQVLVAARPDRLRLDILSPFGVALVLAAGRGRMVVYEPGERTVYRGAASSANLQSFVPVDLPVGDAVDVLLVSPPMLVGAPATVSRDEVGLKLWQGDASAVRVLWFDDVLKPIRYERCDSQGNILARVGYGQYADFAGHSMPARIHIELPSEERSVTIELRDLEVNPELGDAVFSIETPPGSREISLDPEPR